MSDKIIKSVSDCTNRLPIIYFLQRRLCIAKFCKTDGHAVYRVSYYLTGTNHCGPRFTESVEAKAAETPMQKEEYLMKRILGCAVVVMFLGAAPLLAQSFEGNEYEKGKTLYKNKCQFCHGIRGDGKGPAAEPLLGHPVDFTNSKFWQDDVEKKIEDTIKKGKEMMPAFDLEPDEIKAIIWYMSHTFKKATQNNN